MRTIHVETAAQLEAAVREEFPRADVLLMAAAVADFRPREPDEEKISKAGREGLTLELEPTTDVLAAVSAGRRPEQTIVGFAAEHGSRAVERARQKLERKRLDAVVVNDVSRPDVGFEAVDNEVTIVTRDGERTVPRAPKGAVAGAVLDQVEALRSPARTPGAVSRTVEGTR